MSDKPKIYASCKAGCLWETVHKSDFEKSASHILQYPQEDGTYLLEVGKEYKIFAPKIGKSFDCSLIVNTQIWGADVPKVISTPCEDKYADSFVFRLLGFESVSDSGDTMVYEISGVRYSEVVSDVGIACDFVNCTISGATRVLLYNADATITGVQGEKGDKGDTGAKIVSNTYKGQDENGGYIYTLTFDDGSTYDYTIPKDTSHLLDAYPIDSIYISNTYTSPAELFGGTWTQIYSKFLVAAEFDASSGGTATYQGLSAGGSKDAVVVKHNHTFEVVTGDSLYTPFNYASLNATGSQYNYPSVGTGAGSDSNGYIRLTESGVDGTDKNLPPYMAVYMWRRTA